MEWEKLRKWIQYTDFSVQANYDELRGYVDMQGFVEYVSTFTAFAFGNSYFSEVVFVGYASQWMEIRDRHHIGPASAIP